MKTDAIEYALTKSARLISPAKSMAAHDELDALTARLAALEAALKQILYIFDRGLNPQSIGGKACDEAHALLNE